MNSIPSYRFASNAQWRQALDSRSAALVLIDPAKGTEVATTDCRITAFAIDRSRLFLADCHGIHADGEQCGPALGQASRLAMSNGRIVAYDQGQLTIFDPSTLQMLDVIDVPDVIDVSGTWLLRGDEVRRLHGEPYKLSRPAISIAAVGKTLAALTAAGDALLFVTDGREQRATFAELLGELPPEWGDFTPSRLFGGDSALVVSGSWPDLSAGLMLVDENGALLSGVRWAGSISAQAFYVHANKLFVATEGQLLSFPLSILGDTTLRLTPVLETETPVGNWLRAIVEASVAAGSALSLRWAAIDDVALIAALKGIHSDNTRSAAVRAAHIRRLIGANWSNGITYEGGADGLERQPLAFPLRLASPGSALWIDLRLDGPGSIDVLEVFHDNEGVVTHLPAIYRGEGQGDSSFLRLLDVVEATTQAIDVTIDHLAVLLDPLKAPSRWLPQLAAMLGVPFDPALDDQTQRNLIVAAPKILEHRGTTTGVATLLRAIFPNRPIAIIDRGATLLPIVIGGNALPSMLAGPSPGSPRLSARLLLGRTRLCPSDPCQDGLIAPAAVLLVTIPATRRERNRLEAAVRQMIEAMIPAGIGLKLRWRRWDGAEAKDPGQVLAMVREPRPLRTGAGALGQERIGGRVGPGIYADGIVAVGSRIR